MDLSAVMASMNHQINVGGFYKSVSMSLLDKSMEMQEQSMTNLMAKMLPPVKEPGLGEHVDVYA